MAGVLSVSIWSESKLCMAGAVCTSIWLESRHCMADVVSASMLCVVLKRQGSGLAALLQVFRPDPCK